MAGILFIISAPSGSGKSTIVDRLRTIVSGIQFSISWTTRPPRGSEEEGREYHYTSREEFERMIAQGEFLEYAEVFGNYYGTPFSALEDARNHGKDLLLDIDVQGAAQVRRKLPDAVGIFLMPPTPEILETRLRSRSRAEGSVQDEIIARRLAKAHDEIENYREYSYILVNDVLDRAVEEMAAIVLSERAKRHSGSLDAEAERQFRIADHCRQVNAGPRLIPVLRAFGVIEKAGSQPES